jgi:hypothetical protein
MNLAGTAGRGIFYLHKRESCTQLVRDGARFPGFRGCSERPVHVFGLVSSFGTVVAAFMSFSDFSTMYGATDPLF